MSFFWQSFVHLGNVDTAENANVSSALSLSHAWFRIFVWETDAAGTATSFKKGDKVVVTGRFKASTYVTKEGGEKLSLEINADSVGLVPKKSPEPHSLVETKFGEEQVLQDDFSW